MGYVRSAIFATGLMLLAGATSITPAAATTFDGKWNVQITSSSSSCGNGTTLSIGISNGRVESANASVSASGRVADGGDISVTLSSGIKRAVGLGRLSASSGSGTWSGTMCSGTWTAQRM